VQPWTVNQADTWEYKTVTFEGNTSTAITTSTSTGMWVVLCWMAAGPGISGPNFQPGWRPLNQTERLPEGIPNMAGSTSNIMRFTGVQLEVGKVATPFEHRSYGEELALCQRYFYRIDRSNTGPNTFITGVITPTSGIFYIQFPTTMRASPAVTKTGTNYSLYSTQSGVQTSISNFGITYGPFGKLGGRFLTAKAGDAGNGAWIDLNNDDTHFSFDAEL
jgi:hypothetical protein